MKHAVVQYYNTVTLQNKATLKVKKEEAYFIIH